MKNAEAVAEFIKKAQTTDFPPEVIGAAKRALTDWFCVSIGGSEEPVTLYTAKAAASWAGPGQAFLLSGGQTTPAAAAMINGTAGHALDYDDTHVRSVTHIGSPTIAAAMALASHRGLEEGEVLAAIIAGYETAARIGRGLGQPTNMRGFHATGIFGSFGATAAAAVLAKLSPNAVKNALGLTATQASGLTASFGSMAKPFHAGKAAFNGVLAAEMAAAGFEARTNLIEPKSGLDQALFPDGSHHIAELNFSDGWEINQNTFKPYAACLLTHAVIDGARSLAKATDSREIKQIRLYVGEPAIRLAGIQQPETPLQGKFSLAFCVALGLGGYGASESDFAMARISDPNLRRVMGRVQLVPETSLADTSSRVEVEFIDGKNLVAEVPVALGNPENPMSDKDMWNKFEPLVRPKLGPNTEKLFDCLSSFEGHGSMSRAVSLITERRNP
jgi:2-methylcitrate dehydratase PrpD